jgi:hypothetical protein
MVVYLYATEESTTGIIIPSRKFPSLFHATLRLMNILQNAS